MVPTRRHALQALGSVSVLGLAGCTTSTGLFGSQQTTQYRLTIDPVNQSLTEAALYEPSDSALFGEPARTALDEIIPDGTYTTYGYRPLPTEGTLGMDAEYAAGDTQYYQIATVVTGRQQVDRHLVRVTDLPKPQATVTPIDTLPQPSHRCLTILIGHARSRGQLHTEELREDAYVLRRPAELNSQLVTGDLDGAAVTLDPESQMAYRISVVTATVTEPVYTTHAIPVASSAAQFRQSLLAAEVDVELDSSVLSAQARHIFYQARQNGYVATPPHEEGSKELLTALELGDTEVSTGWRLLWYDDQLYRYTLQVTEAS